ncbi:ATP-binding protein [Paenibacillus sp. HN-1]|uniref:ATP-binding protein n=1 Tax=Paenibacillus TaxID=44249 RepID=UPI001CA92DED|nr:MULTISPECIES: ATP-binding protein [Paenibacillus]MBY9079295.1 ATP-binding protein [Paenibacillus sp. CGMCC 1.18879]MBY9087018.1 ATP-binding protein [Paenibacillus sinensis]
MNEWKIPKRMTTALINSLTAGVVPRIGLEHVAVGRRAEIEAILRELNNIAEGGAGFKLITGRYGSGKSFLLQTIRNYAMDRGFAVADADLSPERRLVGTKGQGLGTYRELLSHLSTRTRPDGGALETILQKWISGLQQKVMREKGMDPGQPEMASEVEKEIFAVASEMRSLVHGFDFAKVLASYWNGHKLGDEDLKQDALRWLRGEFATRTESRNALGVGVIIDDDNWYDYMKLWAEFTAAIGYKGLLLFIDEGVNLYKITNSVSRQSNYEKLLTMFNDTMQGKAEHLGIFIGGTPQFVEDHRRGLFSYEALRSRLAAGRYGTAASNNFSGPIIPLEMLSSEEILVLLQKLRDIHAMHYDYAPQLTDDQLLHFMKEASSRLGADELLTPRELVRDFMDLLHTLQGSPDTTFESLVGELKPHEGGEENGPLVDDLLAEFEL